MRNDPGRVLRKVSGGWMCKGDGPWGEPGGGVTPGAMGQRGLGEGVQEQRGSAVSVVPPTGQVVVGDSTDEWKRTSAIAARGRGRLMYLF